MTEWATIEVWVALLAIVAVVALLAGYGLGRGR